MVEKFYALLQKDDGEYITVNAFEAIKLREDASIITNDINLASLFDIETNEKVLPSKGKRRLDGTRSLPYFRYYSNDIIDGNGIPSYRTPEMTIFLEVFNKIKKFNIKSGYDEQPIKIIPKQSFRLHRINSANNGVNKYYLADIFIELDETKPYSFYYKCNGVLALEFLATSAPTPSKRVYFSNIGIPLFEAKANIPKWVKESDIFANDKYCDDVVTKVLNTYYNPKYNLLGKFVKTAITEPEYEWRYRAMLKYEEQIAELEAEISELEAKVHKLEKCRDELLIEKAEIGKEIEEQKLILADYKQQNEYYVRLEKDNARLELENKDLSRDKSNLTFEKDILSRDNANLKNDKDILSRDKMELSERLCEISGKDKKEVFWKISAIVLLALVVVLGGFMTISTLLN